MKNGSRDSVATQKGATRTDLRLTRYPADTPRGRLHRLAATSRRAVDEVQRFAEIGKDELFELRELARRGLALLEEPATRGEELVARFCGGLDRTIFALVLLDADSVAALAEGLVLTLVQLEAAENALRVAEAELEKGKGDVRSARSDARQLRTLLSQAYADAAKKEAEERERSDWNGNEMTSRRELTDAEKRTINGPEAP